MTQNPLSGRRPRSCKAVLLPLLALSAVLACVGEARAQWTQPDASGNINSTNTGNVGVGVTNPWTKFVISRNVATPPVPQDGTIFHLVNADGVKTRFNIDSFGPGAEPSVTFRFARGTAAAPSATQAGDAIGVMQGTGFGTTGFLSSAKPAVKLFATENWTDTSAGSAIAFLTTPTGTATVVERARIDQNGYFGVGTNAPLALFDVNGVHTSTMPQFQVRNGTSTARVRIWADDWAGIEFWKNGTTTAAGFIGLNKPGAAATDDLIFSTYNPTSSWVERMRVLNSNGNVGIGTAAPTSKLHVVSGTTNGTTMLHLDTGVMGGTAMGVGGTVNNESYFDMAVYRGGQYFSRFGVTNFGHVYLQPNGAAFGKVGIGTTNPAFSLDVQGASGGADGKVNASGGLCIAGDCKTAWSQVGGASSQWTTSGTSINYGGGNVGIGNSAPNSHLFVGSGTPAVATLTGINVALGPSAGSYVSVSNNTVNTFIGADGSPYGIVGTLSNHPLGLRANNTLAVTVLPTGNVGIGTTTPGARLDVGAGAAARGSYSDMLIGTGGNNAQLEFYGPTKSSAIAHDETLGGLVFYTNGPSFSPSVFVNNAGNVGIGTTAPAAKLEVDKGGGVALSMLSKSAAAGQWTGLQLGRTVADGSLAVASQAGEWTANAAAGDVILRTELAANRLILNAGGGNSTLVVTNGNVGVGTTAPGQKLDVSGNVNASGLCLAGDCKTAWSQVGGGTSSQWTTNGSNVYYNTGNVGLGTTAPASAKLVVGGAPGAEGLDLSTSDQYANLRVIRNSNSAFDKDIFLQYGAGPNSRIHFYSNNSESMTLAGGNLGIGTATPTAKLDVAGDINVSGNINAKYQDVAEWVPSVQKLQAGTVVVLDGGKTNHVMASTSAYDTAVAGVISARPGIALGEKGEGKLLVATTGRVRVKVDATRAPIKVGDLLVTSDVEGVAMKSEPIIISGRKIHAPGTIVGKALEPLAGGVGEILVLLSLQ
jgi:hypothetical protein